MSVSDTLYETPEKTNPVKPQIPFLLPRNRLLPGHKVI